MGGVGELCDMCMPDGKLLRHRETDFKYFDENTWEELDPRTLEEGERAELKGFKGMKEYDYVSRVEALNGPDGKFVKVKWIRTNKGTKYQQEVKCMLVAQEL